MIIRSNFFFHLEQVHFRLIIASHTDTNLGDWSSLDTCRHTKYYLTFPFLLFSENEDERIRFVKWRSFTCLIHRNWRSRRKTTELYFSCNHYKEVNTFWAYVHVLFRLRIIFNSFFGHSSSRTCLLQYYFL